MKIKRHKKTPADNERFHASGGATRPTLCVEQLLSALVRAVAMPPPAWSRHHVIGKRWTAQWDNEI